MPQPSLLPIRVSSHGGPLSGVPIFYGTPSTFLRSRARRTLGVPNLPGCPRKSGSWSVEDSEDSSSLHVPPLLFGRPLCEDTSSRSGASSPLQFRKIIAHLIKKLRFEGITLSKMHVTGATTICSDSHHSNKDEDQH